MIIELIAFWVLKYLLGIAIVVAVRWLPNVKNAYVRATFNQLSHSSPFWSGFDVGFMQLSYQIIGASNLFSIVNRFLHYNLGVSKSFLKWWFSAGSICMVIGNLLSPVFLYLCAKNLIDIGIQSMRTTLYDDPESAHLESATIVTPIIPGLNFPGKYVVGFWICSLVVTTFHELGHAIAALQENIPVKRAGFFFIFAIPGAFVDLEDEVAHISPLSQLRVYSAGIWHNVLMAFTCLLALMVLPTLFTSTLYTHVRGAVVLDRPHEYSVFTGVLEPGDVILAVNDQPILSPAHLHDLSRSFFHAEQLHKHQHSQLLHVLEASYKLKNRKRFASYEGNLSSNSITASPIPVEEVGANNVSMGYFRQLNTMPYLNQSVSLRRLDSRHHNSTGDASVHHQHEAFVRVLKGSGICHLTSHFVTEVANHTEASSDSSSDIQTDSLSQFTSNLQTDLSCCKFLKHRLHVVSDTIDESLKDYSDPSNARVLHCFLNPDADALKVDRSGISTTTITSSSGSASANNDILHDSPLSCLSAREVLSSHPEHAGFQTCSRASDCAFYPQHHQDQSPSSSDHHQQAFSCLHPLTDFPKAILKVSLQSGHSAFVEGDPKVLFHSHLIQVGEFDVSESVKAMLLWCLGGYYGSALYVRLLAFPTFAKFYVSLLYQLSVSVALINSLPIRSLDGSYSFPIILKALMPLQGAKLASLLTNIYTAAIGAIVVVSVLPRASVDLYEGFMNYFVY